MSTEIVPDPFYKQPCLDPEHNPPGHIVIPEGQMLVHTCPTCGKQVPIRPICARCENTQSNDASERYKNLPRVANDSYLPPGHPALRDGDWK